MSKHIEIHAEDYYLDLTRAEATKLMWQLAEALGHTYLDEWPDNALPSTWRQRLLATRKKRKDTKG